MTLTKAAPPPSRRPPKKLGNLEKAGKQRLKGGGGGDEVQTAGPQKFPEVDNSGQGKAEPSLVIHITALGGAGRTAYFSLHSES